MAKGQIDSAEKQVPIEFETIRWVSDISNGTEIINPGPFFFSNQDDDPVMWPIIGTNRQTPFIEIQSIKGNTNKAASSQSYLNRWVEIPQPPPNQIKISFKTKVSKNPYHGIYKEKDYDKPIVLEDSEKTPKPVTNNSVSNPLNNQDQNKEEVESPFETSISFWEPKNVKTRALELKENDLVNENQPIGSWVEHTKTLTIPELAKFIHFSFTTSKGYNLAIKDWKLKAENTPQPNQNKQTNPGKEKNRNKKNL
jgi:hypothetical protein